MASENDFIRRGDVLELLYYFKEHREFPINYATLLTLISRTWEMPTADAIEVTRCHNCEYNGSKEECPLLKMFPYRDDDRGYCSEGKRLE